MGLSYSLQIWRIATNILKKQSQIGHKGWVLQLGCLGEGLTNSQLKKIAYYEMLKISSDSDGIFGKI